MPHPRAPRAADPRAADPAALVCVAPRRAEIRPAPIGEGDVLIRAEWSAISRGTERLVFEGRVPEAERARMRAPFQRGDFPFPVTSGYACVGMVEEGPAHLLGRHVFTLHPHQTRFRLAAAACLPVPAPTPPRRAALAANMETALNAVWDAGLAPGDRVAVVGAGLVGCLVARLAARIPGCEVCLTDTIARRKDTASELGVTFVSAPDQRLPQGCDVAFNASASAAGLAAAMAALGPEGRLVEMSWHGTGETPVALGGAFHSQRLSIVSSQVGRVPPARAPRWDHRRRLEKALELLDDPALDAAITAEVAFADLPARLPDILAPGAPGVATVVRY